MTYNIVKMPASGPHRLVAREKTLQAARDRLEYLTRPFPRHYIGADSIAVDGATYAVFEE